jgi:hypothetical protein
LLGAIFGTFPVINLVITTPQVHAFFRASGHPFGTMKARVRATLLLTKTLPKVSTEMALSVLAYNLTRTMNMVGTKPLMAAIAA